MHAVRRNMIGAMSTLTVYEKPVCSTCRKLRELLAEHDVEYESIDYHVTGIQEDELRELLSKMGCGPRAVTVPCSHAQSSAHSTCFRRSATTS
jgi:arsenate reductase-like glutaredoxin family protein